jgi:hypothetical protein
MRTAKTDRLEIAYFEHGSLGGWPVVLSHGFHRFAPVYHGMAVGAYRPKVRARIDLVGLLDMLQWE